MGVHSIGKRSYFFPSILAVLLVAFAACSGGSTSGIVPTDPTAEIFIQMNLNTNFPPDPSHQDAYGPLLVCALNELVATGITTDGKLITKYKFELVSVPSAGTHPDYDSGFMETNTDYQGAVVAELIVDTVGGVGVVYFRAAFPADPNDVSGDTKLNELSYQASGGASEQAFFVLCPSDGDTSMARVVSVEITGRPKITEAAKYCTF